MSRDCSRGSPWSTTIFATHRFGRRAIHRGPSRRSVLPMRCSGTGTGQGIGTARVSSSRRASRSPARWRARPTPIRSFALAPWQQADSVRSHRATTRTRGTRSRQASTFFANMAMWAPSRSCSRSSAPATSCSGHRARRNAARRIVRAREAASAVDPALVHPVLARLGGDRARRDPACARDVRGRRPLRSSDRASNVVRAFLGDAREGALQAR